MVKFSGYELYNAFLRIIYTLNITLYDLNLPNLKFLFRKSHSVEIFAPL